jgi:hypothetical protein
VQRDLATLHQPELDHATRQMALCAVHLSQWRGQRSCVKPPLQPVGALPDAGASPGALSSTMRRLRALFAALFAVNMVSIHRI